MLALTRSIHSFGLEKGAAHILKILVLQQTEKYQVRSGGGDPGADPTGCAVHSAESLSKTHCENIKTRRALLYGGGNRM